MEKTNGYGSSLNTLVIAAPADSDVLMPSASQVMNDTVHHEKELYLASDILKDSLYR